MFKTQDNEMIYSKEMSNSWECKESKNLPLVSVLTPAYNESAIIEQNLRRLCTYMKGLEHSFRWEIVVVNDGSKDDTGMLADNFAKTHPYVRVIHHRVNRNLGGALKTGFLNAEGDFIIVIDVDLSYSEDHIEQLLKAIVEEDADIVIASPYMEGGKTTAVPFFRLLLSKVVNRMMRFMAPSRINTYTGMVRAYRTSFLRSLNLKSLDYSINPEIIHKGLILRARIVEIPAHLDWSHQIQLGKSRSSSMRIFNGITSGLMAGFIFRPYMFFFSVGISLLVVTLYILIWIFIHTSAAMHSISPELISIEDRFGLAVSEVFMERPYSFVVGATCLVVSLQFLGIAFLSLQNKRYFDELFHINTTLWKAQEENNQKKQED